MNSELDHLIEELWSAIEAEDAAMAEYFTKQIDDIIGAK